MAGFASCSSFSVSTNGFGSSAFGQSWYTRRNQSSEQLELSECRDVVLVPDGEDYKIRKISEKYPQFCFKFTEPSVLAQYHFDLAAAAEAGSAPSGLKFASFPVFYARIPYVFSPYDFSVQPKSLDRARDQLARRMQHFYEGDEAPNFENTQAELFDGMACAMFNRNLWKRGRIARYGGGADALVDIVDFGTQNIVPLSCIRPLTKLFGRLPPLALRCRMKDVSINELEAAKVTAFQKLIESCDLIVRVELVDVSNIPYLVNLYHPTIEGYNLGTNFYPKPVNPEHEARLERRWQARQARKLGQDSGDDDYDSEYEEEREAPPRHILHLSRLEKPMRQSRMVISHVENSRLIYLHGEYHEKALLEMESRLAEAWPELCWMPLERLESYVACAFSSSARGEARTYRGIVSRVSPTEIEVYAADHGWKEKISLSAVKDGALRLLDNRFADVPFVYLCRLPESMHYHPHYSETLIIRRLLPVGTVVDVHCERGKRTPPYKAEFFMEDGRNVLEVFEKMKKEERVLHPCFELLPYREEMVKGLSYKMPADYQEELNVFTPFAKGKLEYADFFFDRD